MAQTLPEIVIPVAQPFRLSLSLSLSFLICIYNLICRCLCLYVFVSIWYRYRFTRLLPPVLLLPSLQNMKVSKEFQQRANGNGGYCFVAFEWINKMGWHAFSLFENPNAPAVFQWTEQPQIDVQFNIGANKVSEEVTEVELKVNITAKSSQGNAYLVELVYCGLVGIRNVPEDQAHAFLFAEAPRLLFPFARAVISDAVRDAGFQMVPLDPIDFNGLYIQQLQAKREQEAAGAGGSAPAAPEGNA